MRFAPVEPGESYRKNYNRYLVDDVEIFIHPEVVLVGPALKINLPGLWKLRWLDVTGAAGLSTCSL